MRSIATIILGLFAVTILLPSWGICDVAPEPGYKRISINLILETDSDLSDHRFFIKSGADLNEVFVSPVKQTHVSPLGGGAFYSTGTLVAVPTKNLADLGDAPGEGRLSGLQKAVYDGKIPGIIELVSHRFSSEVREDEASAYQDPVYRIERDPQAGLRAVYISGGAAVGKTITTESSGRLFWQSAGAAIVAGIFLIFGITILGVLYFSKEGKSVMKYLRLILVTALFLVVSGFTDCYKPVTNSGLPKHIKTVAVPAFQFEAKGIRYKVETRFTEAVMREVIRRGNGLKVQGKVEGADAVIDGNIRDFAFTGVLLDREGRARVYEVNIVCGVTIRDVKEKKVIYDNQNFVFRDSFEFSQDPRSFFNEEDPAVERIARAFAESVVSAFVNGIGVKDEKK